MDATFTAVARLWEQKCTQREIANRLKISEPKVRKILISIGAIETDESRLFATGLSIEEIADMMGKSPKAVLGRLPYIKGQYGAEYPSINALCVRKSREKQALKR